MILLFCLCTNIHTRWREKRVFVIDAIRWRVESLPHLKRKTKHARNHVNFWIESQSTTKLFWFPFFKKIIFLADDAVSSVTYRSLQFFLFKKKISRQRIAWIRIYNRGKRYYIEIRAPIVVSNNVIIHTQVIFLIFGWFSGWLLCAKLEKRWRHLLISIYCVSYLTTSFIILFHHSSSSVCCVCVCVFASVWFSLVLICCACFFACVCVRCCVTHTYTHTRKHTHTHTFWHNISLCVNYMCIDWDRLWSDRLNLAGWMNATALR